MTLHMAYDLAVLADELYNPDPGVRKDAAADILSARLQTRRGFMVNTNDIRSLAALELSRSGDESHIELLAKTYSQAVKDGQEHPDDFVRYEAGHVQADTLRALFSILERCDTIDKAVSFERKLREAIGKERSGCFSFLSEVADAVGLRKRQICGGKTMKRPMKEAPPVRQSGLSKRTS